MYKFEYRKEDFLSFSKLRQMSFEKIENLLDYLSDGEEELEEVIFRKDRILVRTSKKCLWCIVGKIVFPFILKFN